MQLIVDFSLKKWDETEYRSPYFAKGLGPHLLFQHLKDSHLFPELKYRAQIRKPVKVKINVNNIVLLWLLTDFHDLILPHKPMHCVPYKSLQDGEELSAVAPLSSALQTAQLACITYSLLLFYKHFTIEVKINK